MEVSAKYWKAIWETSKEIHALQKICLKGVDERVNLGDAND